MRRNWATDDVRLLLGREHPLVRRLDGRNPESGRHEGGTYDSPSRYWERDELARILLVLWHNYPAFRQQLADAAIIVGCEVQLLQVARRLQVPALEVRS